MAKYPFLSPEWIEAARKINGELASDAEPPTTTVRMNLIVLEVPFGKDQIDAHLDTSAGVVDIDLGHLAEADVKVSLDYLTAKAILVEGDPQIGMQAFMAGKVRVEGDITKLIAFQSSPEGPNPSAVAEAIRAITL